MSERPLTPRQARFVDEYLIDMNARRAAIRAGYSEKAAASHGVRLLADPRVRRAVDQAIEARKARTQVSTDYVIKRLVEVVERCMQREPVFDTKGNHITDEAGQHVWKFNDRAAYRALELLGKHTGAFSDRIEHSGAVTAEVQIIRIPDNGRD